MTIIQSSPWGLRTEQLLIITIIIILLGWTPAGFPTRLSRSSQTRWPAPSSLIVLTKLKAKVNGVEKTVLSKECESHQANSSSDSAAAGRRSAACSE